MINEEAKRLSFTLGLFAVPLFVVLQFVAFRLNNPLQYISHDGDTFRINGFGPDSLLRLRELQPDDES